MGPGKRGYERGSDTQTAGWQEGAFPGAHSSQGAWGREGVWVSLGALTG